MTDFPPLVIDYHGSRLAGVDEVGRGPLAGPVVAAAVILDFDHPIDGSRVSCEAEPPDARLRPDASNES